MWSRIRRSTACGELTLADPTSRFDAINKFDDGGTGSYNALWLSLERQSANINLRMNYTLSHCIGDETRFNSTSDGRSNISRRGANRGNCDLDQRHSFNQSIVYQTPQFANPTLQTLAGGWRVSSIFKLLSGSFFDVSCGCNSADTNEDVQRAHQLTSNVFASNKTADQWLGRERLRHTGEWYLRGPRPQ